jgi:hypothetical protein
MGLDQVDTTPDESEGYVRVNTNAQTRLTVSAFLASICLSTFAVFLPTTFPISGFDWGSVLAVIVEGLLGGASVFFLVMAAAMSNVLMRLGDLNSSVRNSLSEGRRTQISKKDKYTLDNVIKLYDRIFLVYYLGLGAVLLSLPFMGFHVHAVVGVTVLIAFIGVGICFRKSLRFVIFYRSGKIT